MSLHQLANHMSARGRGPDSMLVHMTPREVAGLQSLAVANGTSLTINPDTGLPEAFSLKDLLPTLAGAAINYFAPGFGTAIGGALGLSGAAGTGLAVGAATAALSGDLGKGLSAGLGAYGGAGISEGLMGLGTGALSAEAGKAAIPSGMDALGYEAEQLSQNAIASKLASSGKFDTLSAGASKAMSDPMSAIKTIGGGSTGKGLALAAAALSPLLAGETGNTVQTVTPKQSTGMIRPSTYDPYEQSYTRGTPYAAANGGLVSFADGGSTQLANLIAQTRNNPAYSSQDIDAAIARHISTGNITQQQIDDSFKAAATPVNIAQGILGSQAQGFGASDINKGLGSYNFTPTQIQAGRDYLSGSAAQSAVVSPTSDFKSTSTVDPQTGIAGLNQNITNYANKINPALVSSMGTTNSPFKQTDLEARIRADMASTGVNDKDVFNATGKTVAQLASQGFPNATNPSVVTDITKADTKYVAPGAGGATGAGQIGGGTTINPNGTITTSPRIPGIPVGGFEGMTQVRNAYTTGGGDLGYTSYAPKTIDEFNTKYKNTGYDKEMYDYLMGKGEKPTKMKNADGTYQEIMRPYTEATLGVPGSTNKRLTWDKVKGEYFRNPDYVRTEQSPIKDAEGKPKLDANGNYQYNTTTYKSINQAKAGIADNKLTKNSGSALLDWATTNNIDEQTVADALGIPMQEVISMFAKAKADKKIPAKNNGLMQLANGGMAYDVGGGVKADYIDSKGDTHVWDWENGIYRPQKLFKNNKSYTWDKAANEYKVAGAGITDLLDKTGDMGRGNDAINPPNTTPITNNGFFSNILGRTTQPAAPVESRTENTPQQNFRAAELNAQNAKNIADMNKQTHIDLTTLYENALQAADAANKAEQAQRDAVTSANSPTATGGKANSPSGIAALGLDPATGLAPGLAPGELSNQNPATTTISDRISALANNARAAQALRAADDREERDIANAQAQAQAAVNGRPGGGDVSEGSIGGGGVDPTGGGGPADLAHGGMAGYAQGGLGSLGGYSDGGRLLRGPGDGVSDSIPASIGDRQPARLADGEFVVPARIVSELGNGSTEAGARALYKMMDRIQANRRKTTGKNSVAVDSKAHKYLPA